MKLFFVALVLAVLAAAALRFWFFNTSNSVPIANMPTSESAETTSQTDRPPEQLNEDELADIYKPMGDSATDLTQEQSEQLLFVQVTLRSDVREILQAVGYDPDQFMAEAELWYRNRGMNLPYLGFPSSADPMQPYEQYDEATLVSFAESGDMWAQWQLGQRWMSSRPADSIAMLKAAAERGSVKSMYYLGLVYGGNFGLRNPAEMLGGDAVAQAEAIIAETPDLDLESARWLGAAEILSGAMYFGPDRGNFAGNASLHQEISPERQSEICDAALQGYQDLQDARVEAGFQPMEIAAPPLSWTGTGSNRDSFCSSPDWPRPDMSHCRQVAAQYVEMRSPTFVTICPPKE